VTQLQPYPFDRSAAETIRVQEVRAASIVLTVCGCHAAGNEVSRQARQQQQHYLPQLGWTAAAFPVTPAACVHSELSWWGLKSSLH
jgi:hypothetical protein